MIKESVAIIGSNGFLAKNLQKHFFGKMTVNVFGRSKPITNYHDSYTYFDCLKDDIPQELANNHLVINCSGVGIQSQDKVDFEDYYLANFLFNLKLQEFMYINQKDSWGGKPFFWILF